MLLYHFSDPFTTNYEFGKNDLGPNLIYCRTFIFSTHLVHIFLIKRQVQ